MYRGTLDTACYLPPSCTGLSPSLAGFSKTVPLGSFRIMQSLPRGARTPVWAPPRSLAATYGITFVFSSSGYLDVSVHRVPSVWLWIRHTVTEVCSAGFPHSDIRGSRDMCSSPRLFAAYHVFLRLSVPRHPSCALLRFTYCNAPSGALPAHSRPPQAARIASAPFCFELHFLDLDVFALYLYLSFDSWIFRYSVFKVHVLSLFLRTVEMVRFELMTPCLQGRCSPN